MFPSSGDQFGGSFDPNSNPFSSGDGGAFGGAGGGGGPFDGPPAADDLFAAMNADDGEDLLDLEDFPGLLRKKKKDEHGFLAIGLHFFESFKVD